MSSTPPGDDAGPFTLERFLDDLRRTGTVIEPSPGSEEERAADPWGEDPHPAWLVRAHRGTAWDEPVALDLDVGEFEAALVADAALLADRWPGGDPVARAYEDLLVSFDASLGGIDVRPHAFLQEPIGDRVHLTTQHPCPDPMPHLDPAGDYRWSAFAPGKEGWEDAPGLRSSARRHADLVRAWLTVEAVMDHVPVDAAVTYLQDRIGDAFGLDVFQRFTEYVERTGFTERDVRAVTEDDRRFDELLDALAGEA